MTLEFTDGGRIWRIHVDEHGSVHDEPVTPEPPPQSLEPSEEHA